MLRQLVLPALLAIPAVGCVVHDRDWYYRHHHHDVIVRDEAVGFDVAAPMPAPRVEVIPERPFRDAVWRPGHWERGPHHWVWVHGYWS